MTHGEIGPHTSLKLEVVWFPTTPGPLSTDFVVKFADPNSNDVSNISSSVVLP